jgi:CBS-domain-containing membrane protein
VNNSEERKLVNFITQSQLLKEVSSSDHDQLLGAKANKPLSGIPSCFKRVYGVRESDRAIDAFNLMVLKKVEGVAVLDDQGKLVSALSIRDLKMIHSDAKLFWRLSGTVKNFIIKLRAEYENEYHQPRRLTFATKEAKISELMKMLIDNHIHRVFIINSIQDRIPIGIVTIKDLLNEFISS